MAPKYHNIKLIVSLIALFLFSVSVSFASDLSKMDPQLRLIMNKSESQLRLMGQRGISGLKVEEKQEPVVKTLLMFEGSREELELLGVLVRSNAGNIFSVEISVSKLETLSDHHEIKFIEASRKLRIEAEVDHVHTDTPSYDGTGVIVGIIDTGIDCTHEDFKDVSGNTRILYIWDQSLTPEGSESIPAGFGYGVEYNSEDINTGSLRHRDTDGHGTHVAGIAVGDGSATGNGEPADTYVGMAPNADIIFVKNVTSTDTLGDSSQLFDAINYIGKTRRNQYQPGRQPWAS